MAPTILIAMMNVEGGNTVNTGNDLSVGEEMEWVVVFGIAIVKNSGTSTCCRGTRYQPLPCTSFKSHCKA